MQKVLRKRVLRDLKENLFRYLALLALIILGMYLIISLVGAAETVINGVTDAAEVHQVEDGEFQVFVPLSNSECKELEKKGISIEKMFYLDYSVEDAGTLRVYQNREEINLFQIEEGRLPEENNEVALEKRYCEENQFAVGDSIRIDKDSYKIVGI